MDGGLIERARRGDADAFGELAQSRIDAVYRTCLAILGRPADARDATQDTLVMLWRGLPSLRNADAFDGWLHRIAVNACRMAIRRRRGIRETQFQPDFAGGAHTPAELVSNSLSNFDRAFERLPVEQRAILLQHHLDGVSIADLATQLGVPAGTIKSRLFAARSALDRALREGRQ